MSDNSRPSPLFSRLARFLRLSAVFCLAALASAVPLPTPAFADEPLEEPVLAKPIDIAPAGIKAPPPHLPGGAINAFVQQDWPKKAYPAPLRKYRKYPPP